MVSRANPFDIRTLSLSVITMMRRLWAGGGDYAKRRPGDFFLFLYVGYNRHANEGD